MFDQFEIETYLGTRTFTNRELPQRYHQSFTSDLVDAISKLPFFDGKTPPNIQHVYVSSFQKRSEVIKTQGGYTFVHDVYATTIFSFVNRFAVKAPPIPASTSFLRAQQALRLTNLGFFDEAEFLLRASVLDGYGLATYLARVQTHKHLAALQDIFLVLHEQAHLLFALSEQYQLAFQEWRKLALSHSIKSSLKHSTQGRGEVVSCLDDPSVQEEAFCDSQAIHLMANLWKDKFSPAGFARKELISAIPLFFLASRLIAVVENAIDNLIGYHLGEADGKDRAEAFRRKHHSIIVRGLLSSYEFHRLCDSGWCKKRDLNDALSEADNVSKICAGLTDDGWLGMSYLFERNFDIIFREQGRGPRRYNPWDNDFFSRREQLLGMFSVDYDKVETIPMLPRRS